jgi:RNA polymerase sigma-70 factor (ECF subfamily)
VTAESSPLTRLLINWSRGDEEALQELMPIVHMELRRIARRALRREQIGHTLQPTALVNELYLRLVDQRRASWASRAQFFAVAAQIMRRILVDHARAQSASKRGGGSNSVLLNESDGKNIDLNSALEVLAVDDALTRLANLDNVQARIVELRFFAGLTVEETAHVLGVSPRTIKREWRLARAWLHNELSSH